MPTVLLTSSFVVCCLACVLLAGEGSKESYALSILPPEVEPSEVVSVSFLVSVNLTWGNCIKTVKTQPFKPNQQWNKTTPITVGSCDHGPLTYTINKSTIEAGDGEKEMHTYLQVTFYTSAIGVQPPSCSILWDYKYLEPQTDNSSGSLLPGCFISDSQEGWHVTYYWFYILEWEILEH